MPVLTDQALLIHCSAKNFLTTRHALGTTVSCSRIYRAGQRLSSFKLLCDLFGITAAVDSTSGTTWAVFSRHFLINSSCSITHEEGLSSSYNLLDLCRKRGRFETGLDLSLVRQKFCGVSTRQMPVNHSKLQKARYLLCRNTNYGGKKAILRCQLPTFLTSSPQLLQTSCT